MKLNTHAVTWEGEKKAHPAGSDHTLSRAEKKQGSQRMSLG